MPILLIDTIKPKNNGTFPIVEAADVLMPNGKRLDEAKLGGETPTGVDLSKLATQGKIVETFADGTTKTTTIEFDADGNPTKVTDGDGNVTVLTW